MKLHNSTDMGSHSNDRKFVIRYHESHSFSTSKKNKSRYIPVNDEPNKFRSCLMSETDVYR